MVQVKVSQLPQNVQPGVRKFIYAYEASSAGQDYYIINAADMREMFGEAPTAAVLEMLGAPLR